jgi:chromosome partitioning protein
MRIDDDKHPGSTLCMANQKGGQAKTTTAVNVGGWFASKGRRVLIVDLDIQGQVAQGFGKEKESGLFRFIVESQKHGEDPLKAITRVRDNLDIIANDHTCADVKDFLRKTPFKEELLPALIDQTIVQGRYDLVILDVPPSADEMHILALVAADYLIVPATMDFYGVDGVNNILRTVKQLSKYRTVTPPEIIGVLPALFKQHTNENQAFLLDLIQKLGDKNVLPPIPDDIKVKESVSRGMTLWEYAPGTRAVVGYEGAKGETNSLGNYGGYLHLCEFLESLLTPWFWPREEG